MEPEFMELTSTFNSARINLAEADSLIPISDLCVTAYR